MARRFGFGKKERLKSKKKIDDLFLNGKRFMQSPLRITYQLVPAASSPTVLVGVTANKKNFKRAVDRNRIKRLIRESYRLQKEELMEAVHEKKFELQVFFLYLDKEIHPFEVIRAAVGRALDKLIKAVNENAS